MMPVFSVGWSAPRRWGYTYFVDTGITGIIVCPTQVGIHPTQRMSTDSSPCLPHAGGDTPVRYRRTMIIGVSAPRRWGYTCASGPAAYRSKCLPHAGGDTPAVNVVYAVSLESAPRRWGYTLTLPACIRVNWVCPTQVGIHLRDRLAIFRPPRLPHAGGDTPIYGLGTRAQPLSAPRRWGYTCGVPVRFSFPAICPTQVGIHPSNLS